MHSHRCNTLIVGGGPAGLAPLISASRDGRLEELLAGGVIIIEEGPQIGAGRLGNYAIWSDSTALTFLSAITEDPYSGLAALRQHPIYATLGAMGQGAVPLAKAAELLQLIGHQLHKSITRRGGQILTQHKAIDARRHRGSWLVRSRSATSCSEVYIEADNLVIATGGYQSPDRLSADPVAGAPLFPKFSDKLFWSDEVLQQAGVNRLFAHLEGRDDSKVAIVGGSTSAMATADLLLRQRPDLFGAPGSIKILHRRPLRLFYRSKEEALADNYTEFTEDDICPISGFVFRLAGFRLHSRELLQRIIEVGHAGKETRVQLHRLTPTNNLESQALLESSAAVIAATGYRPKGLALHDDCDHEIPLMSTVDRGPLVDRSCRIIDRGGRPVPGAFGIGLAAGFVPSGSLGGEKSFVGQANGLWLWQNAVGAIIVDQLLSASTANMDVDPAVLQVAAQTFMEISPPEAA